MGSGLLTSRSIRRVALAFALLFCLPRANWACNSPLVLDLDGDGLYTTGVDRGVRFDLDADGVVERCGWIDPYEDDPFLWLDLNANGLVDDGSELFGDSTVVPDGSSPANGFDALAVYDSSKYGGNEDGAMSRTDLIWASLRLWIDKDYDGISSKSEIFTLEELGVEWIGLDYKRDVQADGNDNVRAYWGVFTLTGGRERDIVDIFFQTRK